MSDQLLVTHLLTHHSLLPCSTDEKSGDTYCADTTTGVWCCPTDKPVTNKGVKILKKSYAKRYG